VDQEHYTVFARKWRPQTFEQVVGQAHVTATLQNAITQGRVGQGYLFIGTRGVGKTTIARILAKALNCLSSSGPTPTPCDTCANCVAIRDGASLDVIEIDGASNRGIEEIRRLRDAVAIAPVCSRFKIYIIDEVHMLTKEAFNALLKTLEEPPSHVKFFFATTEPHRIPATILSRVQKFELRRVAWERLVDYLDTIAKAENIEIDRGALGVIARAGDGSVRDALSVFDQICALAADQITEAEVVALLGWTERETYEELHHAIVADDAAAALNVVQRVIERGRDPEQFVLGLLEFLRAILVVVCVEEPEKILEETTASLEKLRDAAQAYNREQLLYSIDVLLELLPRLAATEAKQTALELAVLKLLHARKRVSLDALLERLHSPDDTDHSPASVSSRTTATQSITSSRPTAVPDPTQAPPVLHTGASSDVAAPGTLAAAWSSLCAELHKREPKLSALLQRASAACDEPTTLRLVVAHGDEMTFQALSQTKLVSRLSAELSKAHGATVTLAVDQAPAAVAPDETAATKDDLLKRAHNEPLVQKALEMFGGAIVDVQE